MNPLLKATRWTRGAQGPPPPISALDWDELGVPDSWDWRARPPTWAWNRLSLNGYPGWEMVGGAPYFVLLECVRGQDPESDKMASDFDDTAAGLFYYRDWTSDNLPWCNSGEVYWSGFWFQRAADAFRFQATYGGIGSWSHDFEQRRKQLVEGARCVEES